MCIVLISSGGLLFFFFSRKDLGLAITRGACINNSVNDAERKSFSADILAFDFPEGLIVLSVKARGSEGRSFIETNTNSPAFSVPPR